MKNEWKKRLSCVTLVAFSKSAKYNKEIFQICENILNSGTKFRFTHLGVGWVLRYIEKNELHHFLNKNETN